MPKALDLFCCQGGASKGLHDAGYDVTGVDIKPQPKYQFKFMQGDAMAPPLDMTEFDLIWASPPCQGYSNLTPEYAKGRHDKLIDGLRAMLMASGKPFCIENVAGARHKLINPIMLCGSMFGLRSRRHRYFETNFDVAPPCRCDHSEIPLLVTTASRASINLRKRMGMQPKTVKKAPLAYGIDWMDFNGLKEAIPPAYSEFIGRTALDGLG